MKKKAGDMTAGEYLSKISSDRMSSILAGHGVPKGVSDMNVSDEIRELCERLAGQQAMPDDTWKPKMEEILAALSVAAQDERAVVASGEQVVRCYGKTPEGHDCVSTYTAQAICDMGRAQTIRSCQNSLPASAIPTQAVGAQVRPVREWLQIAELPDSDDLFWFRRGDVVDGPRASSANGLDADYWEYFAVCEAPSFTNGVVDQESSNDPR